MSILTQISFVPSQLRETWYETYLGNYTVADCLILLYYNRSYLTIVVIQDYLLFFPLVALS